MLGDFVPYFSIKLFKLEHVLPPGTWEMCFILIESTSPILIIPAIEYHTDKQHMSISNVRQLDLIRLK